jgi:hypothetical protein
LRYLAHLPPLVFNVHIITWPQVRRLESEADRLREELNTLRNEADGPTARAAVSRLQGQLRSKDDMLRNMAAAFKDLQVTRMVLYCNVIAWVSVTQASQLRLQ